MKDPTWAQTIEYLEGVTLPVAKLPTSVAEFEVANGVLYHLQNTNDRILRQVVVPRQLRDSALRLSHASPLSAHPGIFRTYNKAKSMFFFPNMLSYTKRFVKTCPDCQRKKGHSTKNAPLASAPEVSRPLERVSADLIKLPQTEKGNLYALVLVDHLSRYVELVPLPDKRAETIATAIIDNFITVYGPPMELQTDGGAEFNNNLLAAVCTELQMKFKLTLPYHPQANGLIERTNRVVKASLRSIVGEHPGRWHSYIPELRLALNSAIHRSTGEQPLYLLTGRHAYFPVGLTNEALFAENDDFQERLRTARRAAVNASRDAQGVYGRYYNRHARGNFTPDVGQLVWYKEMVPRPLGPKWQGPARVVKRLGPVSFEIQDLDSGKILRAHLNHLRPYLPPLELSYADDAAPDSEDEPVNDDPWVAVLTSCVQDPVLSDKQCA